MYKRHATNKCGVGGEVKEWEGKGSGYGVGRKVTRVWEVEEVEGRLGGGGGRVMDEEGWVENNGNCTQCGPLMTGCH